MAVKNTLFAFIKIDLYRPFSPFLDIVQLLTRITTKVNQLPNVHQSPGSRRAPGGGHSNPLQYLAWRIPWTEDLGGFQSMRSQSQTRLKQLSTVQTHIKANKLLDSAQGYTVSIWFIQQLYTGLPGILIHSPVNLGK